MSVQEPKASEADYGWLPKDPDWRRDYIAYREMRAAMTPEEEWAHLDKLNKEARREFDENKRRAAERRRADVAAGVAPAYAAYAAESHG